MLFEKTIKNNKGVKYGIYRKGNFDRFLGKVRGFD